MIAEKRILKPVDAAAARLVADAFRRTENLPGATRDVLLTDGDGEAFRRTYPFSPAFMQTLVHVSSALQRERTALKLMQQILVDRRDDLRLGQLVPFGDLFDAIADGNDQPFTEKLKHEFDRSRSLYQRRMRPMLLEQRKLTDDQAAGRAEVAPAVLAAFRADDRLAKTLLLSALAPDVPALRGMTARRLAALNHGTVHSMIPGQEVAEVIRRLRSWASRVPELKVGQEDDPSVRLQLVGVDTGQILELVAHVDNDAAHRRLFRELLLRELGIGDDGAFELEHAIVWRGSRRSVEIVYGNVRDRAELRDEVFEPAQPGRWRLVLDYPFDAAHFSGAEDRNRLMELKARHDERGPRRCLAWLPGFVTREVLSKVGTLVRIEYLLSGGRLDENATRLGADDRQRARDLLRNQGENLRAELRIVLRQAYGLAKPEDHNVLDWSDHLISLDPALHPKLDVGRSFPDALASLVEQCYAATYPEHPNLDPHRKGQPVSPAEVRTVLAVVRRAIDADGGRTETDKPERPALQRLAHPLRLGEEHGGPFVLSRHWETEFERRAARLPGVDVAVREVRGWLADLGLETRVENLVIATYAELSRRAWVQANQVVDPPASVDDEGWTGTSVLYICPLRALLNNLQPRLDDYAQWLGRSARYWHGDAGQAARRQTQLQRPDFLLTTPESLESMLVSRSVDSGAFLADVRVVVVDEVHAFAGDDRGWHLVHVVERIVQLAGRPLQRIGLSATVGNPEDLLTWLQGAAAGRPRRVVAPPAAAPGGEVQLDHVGSIEGAATVISRLHRGEKRLVFVDSRRRAEELGSALRARDVDTHLSHSSLSATERRRWQRLGDRVLRLRHGTDLRRVAAELRGSKVAELIDPAVDITALRGLKFSAALTEAMARNTVAGRLGDKAGSAEVLREDRVLNRNSEI